MGLEVRRVGESQCVQLRFPTLRTEHHSPKNGAAESLVSQPKSRLCLSLPFVV
jgi:hypothetical protein